MARGRAARSRHAGDPPVVLVDANVLFAPRLRDLFMHLHAAEVLLLHWTRDIETEWTRNVTAKHDADPCAVQDCLLAMRSAVPGWEVAGYRKHIERFEQIHPKDRHVAAAAYKLSRDVWPDQEVMLVTANLKDFPTSAFAQSRVTRLATGEFLESLFTASPGMFSKVAEGCRKKLKAPPLTRRQYVTVLGKNGCQALAAALAVRWKTSS